jgi:hypothetical protein
MNYAEKKQLIESYLIAYNRMDVDAMMRVFHDEVIFRNRSGGVVTLELKGKEALRQQAAMVVDYFETREQRVLGMAEENEEMVVRIAYSAVLKKEIPGVGGPGHLMRLEGKSVFRFREELISELEDSSN